MAISCLRHSLTDAQVESIRHDLSFSPQEGESRYKKKKYKKEETSSKTVQAWKVEDIYINEQQKLTIVRLPFQKAREMFGMNNSQLSFDATGFDMKLTLRKYQETAAAEAIDLLMKHYTVTLVMRMGMGKTVLSLFIAMKSHYRTVVLTPTVSLSKQWGGEIRSKTTAIAWIVGEESEPYYWDIAVCYYGETRCKSISHRDRVGTLILDECHMFGNNTGAQAILSFSPMYTIACSATPTRSRDTMDRVITAVVGDNVVTVKNVVKLYVVKFNTEIAGVREPGPKGVDWTKLKQSLLYNDERNNLLAHAAKIFLAYGIKTLIICFETDHIRILINKIREFYPHADYMCGSKKSYSDSMITIGIDKMCGTGFDEASACENWYGTRIQCVMFTLSVRTIELLKQFTGRAFRHDFPILFYPVDNDSTVRSHYNVIKTWEKEEPKSINPYYDITTIGKLEQNVSKFTERYKK